MGGGEGGKWDGLGGGGEGLGLEGAFGALGVGDGGERGISGCDAEGGVGLAREGAALAEEGVGDAFAEVAARDTVWLVDEVLPMALGDNLATVAARGWAEVHDMVCQLHGIVVVLDNEEGVALGAEVAEGLEEALVVTRVEADGGLVEDVEDAAEV